MWHRKHGYTGYSSSQPHVSTKLPSIGDEQSEVSPKTLLVQRCGQLPPRVKDY